MVRSVPKRWWSMVRLILLGVEYNSIPMLRQLIPSFQYFQMVAIDVSNEGVGLWDEISHRPQNDMAKACRGLSCLPQCLTNMARSLLSSNVHTWERGLQTAWQGQLEECRSWRLGPDALWGRRVSTCMYCWGYWRGGTTIRRSCCGCCRAYTWAAFFWHTRLASTIISEYKREAGSWTT